MLIDLVVTLNVDLDKIIEENELTAESTDEEIVEAVSQFVMELDDKYFYALMDDIKKEREIVRRLTKKLRGE